MTSSAPSSAASCEQHRAVSLRVLFTAPDGTYAVHQARLASLPSPCVVVGPIAHWQPGESARLTGSWKQHPRYGRQFAATCCIPAAHDHGPAGFLRYLSKGRVPGLGPKLAEAIIARFGNDLGRVIETESARLDSVKGVSSALRRQIRQAWLDESGARDVLVFLQQHGLGHVRADKVLAIYGQAAVSKLLQNPYLLARDIDGIGFVTADNVAASLGLSGDHAGRLQAALEHALLVAMDEGHCALPVDLWLDRAVALVTDVPADHPGWSDARCELERAGRIVLDAGYVYLAWLARMEEEVARRMVEGGRADGVLFPSRAAADAAVSEWEKTASITLVPLQRTAVVSALVDRVHLITGGPGVGKTTIVRAIVSLAKSIGHKVLLAAPTGRAARRLASSAEASATTIHRLIGLRGPGQDPLHHPGNPLQADLIVVDEMSMIDLPLFARLLRAVSDRTHLVLVGDPHQLPSVGPGAVLRDLIASERISVSRLTQIFRQAAGSGIVVGAHAINQGSFPTFEDLGGDLCYDLSGSPASVAQRVETLVTEVLPSLYGVAAEQIQVLCPMRRGECGTDHLNQRLRDALNPASQTDQRRVGRQVWRIGDRVILTKNNHDKQVYNGDAGVISAWNQGEDGVVVTFEDSNPVALSPSEADTLQLAYALTIHKSQGSEYPVVVLPLVTAHWLMLERTLLYTAVTRSRKAVVLLGQKKAVAIAVKREEARERWTRLVQRMTRPLA